MKLKYIFILCGLLIITAGCAKPPLIEKQRAEEAVLKAGENDNARVYANDILDRAKKAIDNLNTAYNSKRYDAAKNYADEAIALAKEAVDEGNKRAAKAKEDAASLLSGLRPEIEETSRNVNEARYSLKSLDYDSLDEGIKNAYNTTDQAEVDQAGGRYNDAIEKGKRVRADLADINNQVANAVIRRKI